MAVKIKEEAIKELRALFDEWEVFSKTSRSSEGTTYNAALYTRMRAALERWSPSGISYEKLVENPHIYGLQQEYLVSQAVEALLKDYEDGFIRTAAEIAHAEVFSDMLDAAQYFLDGGYKVPAAVMAGAVMEEHLRQLAAKNTIDTTVPAKNGTRPKMADALNADLAKAGVYGALEQKQITYWAGIRNAAAHGKVNEFNEDQVKEFIPGLVAFMMRYPA